METRTNGAFGCFENLGNIPMGHALDVEHRHNHSVGFRQLHHRFVQFYLKFVEIRLSLGIRLVGVVDERGIVLHWGIHVIQAQAGAAFSFLQKVER